MDLRRLVVVFARTPRDEAAVKSLGARARAERLHRALLDRALATARAVGCATRLVTRQRGDSFGARLEHAVADAFADGWQNVVVIGADAPALDAERIREAFACLSGGAARAVIGPARDGGYYLIGLTRFDASLFRAIPFCTGATFAATVAALDAAGFARCTLPPLDDVDTLDDVRRLARSTDPLARLARTLLAIAIVHAPARAAPPRRQHDAFVDARGPPAPAAPLL